MVTKYGDDNQEDFTRYGNESPLRHLLDNDQRKADIE